MDKFKNYTKQLYFNCSEMIIDVSSSREKFQKIYEKDGIVLFDDNNEKTIQLNSTEMILKHDSVSIYYRDNIIQFCMNKKSYVYDVIYIPSKVEYSFYTICNECDLFQLSTLVDLKYIQYNDIKLLNNIKEYFEYRYLTNNV